jgi:MOSC domain-containing protein YiiM
MKLDSIFVGQPREIPKGDKTVLTSIRKSAVPSAAVHRLGVEGDTISDQEHHGGYDQAVYVYSQEEYDWWNAQLEKPFAPGSFGENLVFDTYGGDVMVGDRFAVGSVTLEATAPRIPCWVFAHEVETGDMVKQFRASGKPGFYARVVQEGTVTAGDEVTRTNGGHDVSIRELFDLHYVSRPSTEDSLRVLSAPVASRTREQYQTRLERAAEANLG